MTLARVAANFGVALVSIVAQHLVLLSLRRDGSSVPPVCVSSRVSPNIPLIFGTYFIIIIIQLVCKENFCETRGNFSLSSRLVSSLGKF